MKTKKEIEQLAKIAIPLSHNNQEYIEFAEHDRKQWSNGYIQCQKDNKDRKYTLLDMEKCFIAGGKLARNFDNPSFREFLNLLNKQK